MNSSTALVLMLLFSFFSSPLRASSPPEEITLQLRWHHQFQFAGYYAAIKQGFYQQKGLKVHLVEGSPHKQSITEVLAGRAQYGVANGELLQDALNGAPLRLLAAIMQHSPSALITLEKSHLYTPQDLVHKRVMMMLGKENDIEFLAMFNNEGVAPEKVQSLPSSYQIEDLITGKTDAFNAYLTNEPFYLEQKRINYSLIKPVHYGIDFYSDFLFTSQQEIEKHPDRVKAFREASLQGWEYAMQHSDELIQWIHQQYAPKKSLAHLQYEAETMKQLMLPDLVTIGHINIGRLQHMAEIMQQFNLIPPSYDLEKLIYQPNPKVGKNILIRTLVITGAIISMLALLAFWFWRMSHKLQKEMRLRKATEASLKISEQHFRNIINNLQDVYFRTDLSGTILEISPSVKTLAGVSPAEVIGQNMAQFYAPPFDRQHYLQALQENNGKVTNYEIKIQNLKGDFFWIENNSQFFYVNGHTAGIEGTLRDITEKKAKQQQMLSMAFEDPLTGLPNRRALLSQLEKYLANAQRHQSKGILMFVDLDHFKPINDTHGHHTGDKLLQQVAIRLKNHLRQEDSIYRIGGDEFVILFAPVELDKQPDHDTIQQIADKIKSKLNQEFYLDQLQLHISASIGVTCYPVNDYDADQHIQLADQAMYQAKHQGKNQVQLELY